jgi:hypothetical protein
LAETAIGPDVSRFRQALVYSQVKPVTISVVTGGVYHLVNRELKLFQISVDVLQKLSSQVANTIPLEEQQVAGHQAKSRIHS